MKNVWNDPVWSKVIAGIILLPSSAIVAALYRYFSSSGSAGFYEDLTGYVIEVNGFILTTTILFAVSLILVYLFVTNKKYDLFFSAPMSVKTEEEYKEIRDNCLLLIKHLKENTPYKNIYFAAENISTMADFGLANHAVIDDLAALRKSRRFILYMPKKLPSSAIFEAGYAFRKNLPTVYFCHNDADLPFLLRDLNDSYRAVRKYRGSNIDSLINNIKGHGKKIFTNSL